MSHVAGCVECSRLINKKDYKLDSSGRCCDRCYRNNSSERGQTKSDFDRLMREPEFASFVARIRSAVISVDRSFEAGGYDKYQSMGGLISVYRKEYKAVGALG